MKLKRKEQKEAERIEQDITFRIKIPNDSNAKSSPIRSHRLFNRPRKNALVVNEAADEFREVADETSDLDIGFRSLDFNARTVSAVNETCPWTPIPRCTSSYHRNYRTNDGSCNNLKNPNLGKTETPFQRILPSAYSGISSVLKYFYNVQMPV